MAERIKVVTSARALYPWQRWMDGQPWRCKRGKDFPCTAVEFRKRVIVQARRAGVSVTTAVKGDSVEFQFSKT